MLEGRKGPFKHFSGEQMASSWTPPGNLCSFKWETWPYKTLNESVTDHVVTSDSHLHSTLPLLFQQPSCGWELSALNTPVTLPRAAGASYSLLPEEIPESAHPSQPAFRFEVSTMTKFVVTFQRLSKIIRDFMSADSNAHTWAFSRYAQTYLLAPTSTTLNTLLIG